MTIVFRFDPQDVVAFAARQVWNVQVPVIPRGPAYPTTERNRTQPSRSPRAWQPEARGKFYAGCSDA